MRNIWDNMGENNVRYKLAVIRSFRDRASRNRVREVGESFTVSKAQRAKKLLALGLVRLLAVQHIGKPKQGNKIIVYQSLLYKIGGIETWCQNMARIFADRDITFLLGRGDPEQMLRIGKYCNVAIDDTSKRYECDVLIVSSCEITEQTLGRIKSRKMYQYVHADFSYLIKDPIWAKLRFKGDDRRDAFIAVSETARKGLKEAFDEDSIVINNPMTVCEDDGPRVFVTLSRATSEKGIERVVEMAERFEGEGLDFVWFLCSTLEQCPVGIKTAIQSIPEIVVIPPGLYNKRLIRAADYLVQLSDSESYCYSIREALQMGVPVIVTDFEEAKKIVYSGKNGFIVKKDLSDLDVAEIFKSRLKFEPYSGPIDPKLAELLDGRI